MAHRPVFFEVKDLWKGAEAFSDFEKQVLTLLSRIEISKPIKLRRKAAQLIEETKELVTIKSKEKLLVKVLEARCL
ncbi:hypothetical protein [Algibacter sp. PT7-4]|uniref:hypothetical protein n=1 Tax=Algibacter ulvanivorans TaxID=3400999 RepID=UPI003AB014E7